MKGVRGKREVDSAKTPLGRRLLTLRGLSNPPECCILGVVYRALLGTQSFPQKRIDPLLFHALPFKAYACIGHAGLFTVTSMVDPCAHGIRVNE